MLHCGRRARLQEIGREISRYLLKVFIHFWESYGGISSANLGRLFILGPLTPGPQPPHRLGVFSMRWPVVMGLSTPESTWLSMKGPAFKRDAYGACLACHRSTSVFTNPSISMAAWWASKSVTLRSRLVTPLNRNRSLPSRMVRAKLAWLTLSLDVGGEE